MILAVSARRRGGGDGYGQHPEGGYPLPTSGAVVTIPTYDGSGASIHPSVVDMGRPWNGYRWWFADTPYPASNDTYENPSIFASNDRANWVVPAGVSNPLAPDPDGPAGPGFNSDVDLVWDPDEARLVVYWRDYIASRTPQMYLRVAYSLEGSTWTVLPQDPAMVMTEPWQSPMVSRVGPGQWRLWRYGDRNPPGMWVGPTSLGPWTFAGTVSLTGAVPAKVWHGDIIRHPSGQWIATFSTTTTAYPAAVSDDGLTWHVGAELGWPSYRPTMCVSTEAGMIDVWSSRQANYVNYYRHPESTWLDLAAGLP